jgi:hypothetical protein
LRVFKSRITQDWCWRCNLCQQFGSVYVGRLRPRRDGWRYAMGEVHAHLLSDGHRGALEVRRARLIVEGSWKVGSGYDGA